jgi:hypothetical protein
MHEQLNHGIRQAMTESSEQVTQATGQAPTRSMLFFNSPGWSSAVNVILSFYTATLINMLVVWNSGPMLLAVMIVIFLFWWVFLEQLLSKLLVAENDGGQGWNMFVLHMIQSVTMILIFMISQYGLPLIMNTWTRVGFGPGEAIVEAVVLLMLAFAFVGTLWQTGRLSHTDTWTIKWHRRDRYVV